MLKLSEIKDEDGGGECDIRIRVDMFINSVVEAAKILSDDLRHILDNGKYEKLSPKKIVEIIPHEVINDTHSSEELLSTNKQDMKRPTSQHEITQIEASQANLIWLVIQVSSS